VVGRGAVGLRRRGSFWGCEKGSWTRDKENSQEGDERSVLCGSREGFVKEDGAAVGGYGGCEEGDYHCIGDRQILKGVYVS
jgi:hypothetical protein